MEVQNKKPQSQPVTLSNLKELNSNASSASITAFFNLLNETKKELTNSFKALKAREESNVDKKATAEKSEAKETVAKEPESKIIHRTFAPKPDRPREDRPRSDQRSFNRNNNANANGGFNKTGVINKNKDNSARPNPAGYRPTPIEPTIINQKPERNFGNKNKSKTFDSDKKELTKKAKIRMGYIIEDDDFMDEDRIGRVRTKAKKAKEVVVPEKVAIDHAEITTDNLTVKILSEKIGKPAVDIIKKFMMLGMMLNINSNIDFATAELVASEFGITLTQNVSKNYEEQLQELAHKDSENMVKRPPIVTVMGHVDHGKTSLLDALRKTSVTSSEAGGITQHIGAYSVSINGEKITFIDTPGHEAFTSMRKRGAMVTDIAILVVAADDGIMPQTIEAIKHIKTAKVPVIVAINKIDKPEANVERVKQQLTEYDLLPEEWGGDTICVPISAKNGINLDKLLEAILLVAEMQELKADPCAMATADIIESKIDKGRGVVANAIVKTGTLRIGDFIVSGVCSGRVRAMVDYTGKNLTEATPSTAVSILGFTDVPDVGDTLYVVDEKMAKNIIEERMRTIQIEKTKQTTNVSLESFLQQTAGSELKEYNVIIKADVKGSAEAIKQTVEKIHNEEVKVVVISTGVGNINETDAMLAQASHAVIIAFNVKPDAKAREVADKNKLEIKQYKIIYDIVDDLNAKIATMITPKYEDVVVGHAEIRQIFKISSKGNIAGSYILDGVITRGFKARVMRGKTEVAVTEIETLQQGKDEAKTLKVGYECGIKLKGFNDIMVGDIIECVEAKRIN